MCVLKDLCDYVVDGVWVRGVFIWMDMFEMDTNFYVVLSSVEMVVLNLAKTSVYTKVYRWKELKAVHALNYLIIKFM